MASSRKTPVILSAARLKEVMFQFMSTVKTPSAMESRIISLVLESSMKRFWLNFSFLKNSARDVVDLLIWDYRHQIGKSVRNLQAIRPVVGKVQL
jgi:hypothetical protein